MIKRKLSEVKEKFVFLEKDDNDRQINIYTLKDVNFVGQNLFYPNTVAFCTSDNKLFCPLEEKTMSLASLGTDDRLENFNKKTNKIYEKPVFFFVYNTDNYYHFLYDTLPYLISFLHLKKQHHDLKLLVNFPNTKNKKLYKFIVETFELLKISSNDLAFIDGKTKYKTVFISSSFTHGHNSNLPPRSEIHKVINLIKDSALQKKVKIDTPKKIYISRRSWKHNDFSNIGTNYTTRRKLECEDLLVEKLIDSGYKEVFCENLSMTEKIHLFHNAEKIVGPIGGGLVNALFSNKTTELFVICSPVFFDVNSRFKFSFDNVTTKYYEKTGHVEKDKIKKFMRVITKDNYVGEVIDVSSDHVIINYSDGSVAGWNNEIEFKKMACLKKNVKPLDCGLNSSWTFDVDDFLRWMS
ncbi:MAG: glycosyltransferase family 61 protein [Promethearchaeota archaeon]